MTDFVSDLKTRLLEQAAELGITPQTARLLAAAIDAIRATLKQDVHAALSEMEREFAKRLNQIGNDE